MVINKIKKQLLAIFTLKRERSSKWGNFLISLEIGITSGLFISLFTFILRNVEKGIHFILGTDYINFISAENLTLSGKIWQSLLIFGLLLFGGFVSGLFNHFLPTFKGSHTFNFGADAVITAYNNHNRFLNATSVILRTLVASPILIASGGSAGIEGTVTYLGGGIGSLFSQLTPALMERRRMLLICGASACIGAVFHAPLGASIYMAEVLYFSSDMDTSFVAHSIIAAVTSYAVFILFFGHHAMFDFHIPPFKGHDLIFTIGLSIAIIPFSYTFTTLFNKTSEFFQRLPLHPILKPTLAMGLLGIILLLFPYGGGIGYYYVQGILDGNYGIVFISVFIIVKIINTALTVGSGGNGGLFGPSIVIGAMVGALYALLLNYLGLELDTEIYVVLGMAAFLSSTENTPISSIIMISEITGTYELLIPLSLASVTSFFLGKRSILYRSQVQSRVDSSAYHGKILDIEKMQEITVGSILSRTNREVPPISASMSLTEILEHAEQAAKRLPGIYIFPVYRETTYRGIINTKQLQNDIESGKLKDEMHGLLVADDLVVENYRFLLESDTVYEILHVFLERFARPVSTFNIPVLTKEKKFCGVLRAVDVAHLVGK